MPMQQWLQLDIIEKIVDMDVTPRNKNTEQMLSLNLFQKDLLTQAVVSMKVISECLRHKS